MLAAHKAASYPGLRADNGRDVACRNRWWASAHLFCSGKDLRPSGTGGEVVTMTADRRVRRSGAEVSASVRPIVDAVAESCGLVVWSVTFLRSAGRETLRVAVDRLGGVVSDELAVFADRLSKQLDEVDVVPGEQTYILETTSPGAERKLERPEQFRVCVGRQVKVVLRDGRTLEGEIAAVDDRAVEVATGPKTARALFDDIAKARLVMPRW
jgi:ribosome maturation factor RimP